MKNTGCKNTNKIEINIVKIDNKVFVRINVGIHAYFYILNVQALVYNILDRNYPC